MESSMIGAFLEVAFDSVWTSFSWETVTDWEASELFTPDAFEMTWEEIVDIEKKINKRQAIDQVSFGAPVLQDSLDFEFTIYLPIFPYTEVRLLVSQISKHPRQAHGR